MDEEVLDEFGFDTDGSGLDSDPVVGDASGDVSGDYSESSDLPVAGSDSGSLGTSEVIYVQSDVDAISSDEFQSAISEILESLEVLQTSLSSDDETLVISSVVAFDDADPDFPFNVVTFDCNGVSIFLPFSYADSVFVSDGELVNLSDASITVSAQIGGSSVSDYVTSDITIPVYHSSVWYQYLMAYGDPYRIVDRYISNNNSYSSYTRTSVELTFSGGNDWAGFSWFHISLFAIIGLLVLGHFFRKD